MASLTKTYTRDLSTAIAGKLWEAIKDADERRELEKSKASEEVKQAAVKLKKDDGDKSIPVKDKDLRETVVKIFGPLEGKILQTEGRIDNLSGKVTAVAGGIADTQKLIINQNQILEDKFDQMIGIIGGRGAIAKQKEAEHKYKQLELDIEKGFDLSGTFGTSKTSTGAYGIVGKLLSSFLGNKWTAQLAAQIGRALIPKGIRSRARLLRQTFKRPFRKFATSQLGSSARRLNRFLQPFMMHTTKGFMRMGYRFGSRAAGVFLRDTVVGRRWVRGGTRAVLGTKGSWLSKFSLPNVGRNFRRRRFLDPLIRFQAKNYRRSLTKGVSEATQRTVGQKLQDSILKRILSSHAVQRAIVERLGEKAAKRIGIKAAAGGVKGGFPIVGTGYAVIEGLVRLIGGDPKGMMLSFGSGMPWAGWSFAVIDILRDIDREAYTRHIEPNLIPWRVNDTHLQDFFMEAFGITPDMYERGNVTIKSPAGSVGNSASAISEILGVTKAFGDATGFGGEVQGQIDSENLSSYPIPRVNYVFDVGGRSAMRGFDKQAESEDRKELKMIKREEKVAKVVDNNKKKRRNKSDKESDNESDNKGDNENKKKWWNPFDWFRDGEGGIGGNDVVAQTPIMGGSPTTIEFWGQQGVDKSGEPGVDFSYKDYKSNYNLFPGYVLETGLLYGNRYGNVVVVRSTDPSNGKEFDSLYSHFPDGGIAVKPGQVVSAGDYLGKVGFVSVDVPGVPQMQPNNAGNMSGWHTSVDFFEPGSAARYHNANKIINLVTSANGQTPHGLLEKLKPVSTSGNESSLNNIESNSNLATAMTGLVENGSMERHMIKRKSNSRSPIVIINNQIIEQSSNTVSLGNGSSDGDFFEAYNLAKFTV